eukprot:TRINITY_DN9975_c0_g1_i2.p1 TRINITY_DN9975_c0_g1~~TRINITY_DN9975_c0_g1_i2.p1  ORF type:complete len:209 (+),score=34.96 TRINITY_DN9975_c0_g1_i2:60-629(+)
MCIRDSACKVQGQISIPTDLSGLFHNRDHLLGEYLNSSLHRSPDFQRYSTLNERTSHEAGSNAYMTSVLFIALTNFLANESKSLETRASKLPIDWTAIDLFRGRIYPYYHFSLADLDNDALEHDPEFNQTVIFFRLLSGNIQQKHLEQLKISNTLGEIEISISGSSSGFMQFLSAVSYTHLTLPTIYSV